MSQKRSYDELVNVTQSDVLVHSKLLNWVTREKVRANNGVQMSHKRSDRYGIESDCYIAWKG